MKFDTMNYLLNYLRRMLRLSGFVICLVLFFSSCSRYTAGSFITSSFETQVIAAEMSEIYVLRVQGIGDTYNEAERQAYKQAVHDMIFKNLYKAYGDYSMLFALVNDPRIEKQEEAYFSDFFADHGGYRKFIIGTRKRKESSYSESLSGRIINVAVNRGELRRKLVADGIIK